MMETIFDQVWLEEALWEELSQRGLKYILKEKVRQIETFYVETILNGQGSTSNIRSVKGNGFYKIRYDYSRRIPFRISEVEGNTRLELGKIMSHQEGEQLHKEEYVFRQEITVNFTNQSQETTENQQLACPHFFSIGRQLLPEDEQRIIDNADADLRRILNQAQNQFLQEQGPILLKGTAGSGKTTVCIYRLLQSLTSNKIYVTYTPYLKEYAEKIFLSLTVGLDVTPVKFFTFEEFCFSLITNKKQFKSSRKMNFEVFKSLSFVEENVRHYKVSPYILWEEIRGVLKQQNQELNYQQYEAQSESKIIAKAAYSIYRKYQDYLQTYQMWDDVDLARSAWRKYLVDRDCWKYDEIIVDEVQDLTKVHFQLLTNAVNHPTGLFLAGDESQSIHPSKFSWKQVETILNSNVLVKQNTYFKAYRRLVENYRSPQSVFELVKKIKRWRQEKWHEVDDVSDVVTHQKEGRPIELISPDYFQDFQVDIAPTNTMILVPFSSLKEEAIQRFGVGSVLTITEAKGLENQNIVLYKFFEEQQIYKNLEKQELHSCSERFSRSQVTLLNLLHVALTRAEKQVFIISDQSAIEVLPPCKKFPFQVTKGETLKDILNTQQEDAEQFFIWGRKLEQAEALAQAEANYIKAGNLGHPQGFAYGNKCRGLLAKAQHRYQDAIEALKAALTKIEDVSILKMWEECSGLIALENNQLAKAKDHFLSAEIPPETIINQVMSASSDDKYQVALEVILRYCPQKLESFHKDQNIARKISLSVTDAFKISNFSSKVTAHYARLRQQFYQEKLKKQCRDKYQKVGKGLSRRLGKLSPQELKDKSPRVREIARLQSSIDRIINHQEQLLNDLSKQEITSISTQSFAEKIDKSFAEVKTLLNNHPQNWNQTLNQFLNHRLGEVRISLLQIPYLEKNALRQIIQKIRKPDMEEVINYLIDNQRFLPDLINLLLSKSPDPDLVLKLHNRVNANIQKECGEYLIKGYTAEPSLSPHFLEFQFEIKTKTVRTRGKQPNRFYKQVRWLGKEEEGTTLFEETRRGWLIT